MAATFRTLRLAHGIRAIAGGQGQRPPLIVIPGWPQTAEAFSGIFEALAEKHRFFALDPPGLGDSSAPSSYDTTTVSKLMAEAIHDVVGDGPYHLIGHDVGGWIAYPWAAQFQSRVKSLSILDASIPGFLPQFQFPMSRRTNMRLWQFSFFALPELPEILTRGRERELLTWFFNLKTVNTDSFRKDHFERYIQTYSKPGAFSRSFEYYRAFEKSAEQNLEFAKQPLDVPTFALGGANSVGASMVDLVQKFAASKVSGGAIDDCGHFLPEEQPSAVAQKLLEFLDTVDSKWCFIRTWGSNIASPAFHTVLRRWYQVRMHWTFINFQAVIFLIIPHLGYVSSRSDRGIDGAGSRGILAAWARHATPRPFVQ
jgi:pimeloyl-ACP methyl ester carboxylesterase